MLVTSQTFQIDHPTGFIVLDGVNGAGKTTIQNKIIDYLKSKNIKCVSTREPGATQLGQAIRSLVVEAKAGKASPWAEVFLFAADRAEHVENFIKPNIKQKNFVVCDRYYYSTIAFQGYGRGLDLKTVRQINEIAIANTRPDLALFFDLPVEVGLERTGKRNSKEVDSFESEELIFHEKLRQGFLELARDLPEKCAIINANCTPEEVWQQVLPFLNIWTDKNES